MKEIHFNQNKNIIHNQLRILRNQAGLSQSELAQRLHAINVNLDQQMISKIEKNQRLVTDYEFASLCKVLETDESAFLQACLDELKISSPRT